jgi:hypothetical protein
LRHSVLVVAALALAVPAAAGDKPDMVRPSRCPAMGRGMVMVMHYTGLGGDPNGSGGPWSAPPPPVPFAEEEPVTIPPMAAALDVPPMITDWGLRATADFDGDWVCDLVWSKAGRLAITITDGQGPLPIFRDPTQADVFAEGTDDWVVLGSGDFASAAVLAPVLDGNPDLVLRHLSTGAVSIWAGDGAGGFPVERRYDLQGALPLGTYGSVIANIDGLGAPELVLMNSVARRLEFRRVVAEGAALHLQNGGLITPSQPVQPGWTLRAADDFDGDGFDDLVFQNDETWISTVWYMGASDATLREGHMFVPARLTQPHLIIPNTRSPIMGPR